jgi:hypothetical protein
MTVERVGRLVIYIVASAVALDLIAQFWGVFVPVFSGIGLFTFLLAPCHRLAPRLGSGMAEQKAAH